MAADNVHWPEAFQKRRPLEKGDGGGNDGDMEARVAKLEAAVEYIQRDVAEIKGDVKSMDQALRQFGGEVNGEFKAVRAEARADFVKLFSALIVATLGLAGLMAKGFGWL